jgi:hypothetical protein
VTSEAIPILVNGRHDVQQRNNGPAGVREVRDDGTFLGVQVTLELTLEQTRVERSFVCQLAVLAVRCLADGWTVRGLGWCGNSRESPGCLVWHARIKNGVPGVWRAAGLQPRLSLACTLHTAHCTLVERRGGTLGLARASSGSQTDCRDDTACSSRPAIGGEHDFIRWRWRAALLQASALPRGAGQ